MRITTRRILLPAAALAMAAAGCTPGTDDAAPSGQSASEVCGGFAEEPGVASALEAIAGKDVRLTADRSEPDRVLSELRKAARTPQSGKRRMEGIPFCTLETAGDEKNVLSITLREALAVPGSDASKDLVTAYTTGRLATSSDLYAAIYFTCRMPRRPTRSSSTPSWSGRLRPRPTIRASGTSRLPWPMRRRGTWPTSWGAGIPG